jgi:hypothetical protein
MTLFYFLLLTLFAPLHPVHISSTSIDFDSEKKAFIVSIKVFTDDFELAIEHKYNTKLNLGKENENKEANSFIHHYILGNFAIIVNEKDQTRSRLKFIGKRFNHEAVWLDYELKYIGDLKKVKIVNSIIHDVYFDQKNLLIFSYKDKMEAHKLTYSENSAEIILK